MADIAIKCAHGIVKAQKPLGYWSYPRSAWVGRIATLEVAWAALGVLASRAAAAAQAWTWPESANKLKLALERGLAEFAQ